MIRLHVPAVRVSYKRTMIQPNYKTNLVLLFILALLMLGCGAQKRHDRLVAKYGNLCTIDTVRITDTIIKERKIKVPEFRDSFVFVHDTTYETKEVIITKKGNTIYVHGKPREVIVHDTIPYEVKVPAAVIKEKCWWDDWWKKIAIASIIGLCVVLILRYLGFR